MLFKNLIDDFVSETRTQGKVELYNEAGLRHELACFIEQKLPPDNYGVQIEREAQAVVLEASNSVFQGALLDIYIFERAGKGQYCLQVLAQNHQNHIAWEEAFKQVKLLEQLSAHGFQETCLFLAYQQHDLNSESELKKSILNYTITWKELLPAAQDKNGSWKYFLLQTNSAK